MGNCVDDHGGQIVIQCRYDLFSGLTAVCEEGDTSSMRDRITIDLVEVHDKLESNETRPIAVACVCHFPR